MMPPAPADCCQATNLYIAPFFWLSACRHSALEETAQTFSVAVIRKGHHSNNNLAWVLLRHSRELLSCSCTVTLLAATCRGFAAVILQVLYYAAPLSTFGEVISKKSSASLYPPGCFMNTVNSALWAIYGIVSPSCHLLGFC